MKWSQFFAMAFIVAWATGHTATSIIYIIISLLYAYKEFKDDELDDEDME